MRPGPFVLNVRKHESHCLAKTPAIGQSKREQIVAGVAQSLADGCESRHVEKCVVVRLRTPQLFRKTSVRCDLIGNEYRFETVAAEAQQFFLSGECGKLRNLRYPPGAMIVFGVALVLSIL